MKADMRREDPILTNWLQIKREKTPRDLAETHDNCPEPYRHVAAVLECSKPNAAQNPR